MNKKHQNWLKSLGMTEHKFSMGMFDFDIIIAVGPHKNIEEYVRFKLNDDEFDDGLSSRGYEPRGKCYYRDGYVPIIWIPRKPRTPREYATLAHECLHAMYHVVRWAGIPLDDSTEEMMTHGTAHIMNNALESFKK